MTDYYRALVDWDDPHDPLHRLIAFAGDERYTTEALDPSNEAANTRLPGLQHKYRDTALLLVTNECAGYCRYCFRKRLFLGQGHEARPDCSPGLAYIREHVEITDVLLTGGDPLTMPTEHLGEIVDSLLSIEHVRTIRIGSKVPAFEPERITNDGDLAALVYSVAQAGRSFYLMAHFDHPRELTREAVEAIATLRAAGAMCLNQCPLTHGINDDPLVLAELLQACTDAGCPQYYIFQCRPTRGNRAFIVPLVMASAIIEQARRSVSGLSRRARFCLSHATGKIEIVGTDDRHLYARYHRAKQDADAERFMIFRSDPTAGWLDELVPATVSSA